MQNEPYNIADERAEPPIDMPPLPEPVKREPATFDVPELIPTGPAGERIKKLTDFLRRPDVMAQITYNMTPDAAAAFVGGVLTTIRRSASYKEGDKDAEKKDLTLCSYASIANACIDATRMRLPVDGRQLAHLVRRGKEVQLQIGYRGYLARLQQHLPGFFYDVKVVYKGETFTVKREGMEEVPIMTTDPFAGDIARTDANVVGAYAYMGYLVGDKVFSFVEAMPRSELDKVRDKAAGDFIWKAWFTEKCKVAVVRRASKGRFAALTHDLDQYDNRDFMLDVTPNGAATNENTRNMGDELGAGLIAAGVAPRA